MPESEAYQIQTYNRQTGASEFREVAPLPTPKRIQAPKTLTKPELIEMIDALRDDMATEQKRFDNKDAIDNANTAKRQELHVTIADLTQLLNAAQAELDQLKRAGSVRDGYIDFAARAEQRITSIATGVYGYLLEKFSQDRHEAPFAELIQLLKEDVRFKADRSGVRIYTLPGYARFHTVPKDQITNARIEGTLRNVSNAADKLQEVLNK